MRNRPRRKGSTFAALLFFATAAALSVVIALATTTSGNPEPVTQFSAKPIVKN